MVSISLKVTKVGQNIDDEVLASLMLAGLPDQFQSLVMAIENSATKLTSDAVKTMLLQESRLDKSAAGNSFFSKKKKQGKKRSCGIHVGNRAITQKIAQQMVKQRRTERGHRQPSEGSKSRTWLVSSTRRWS